jgi:FtsZ-binding cell division protein ZapB|tara:strand:- start:747 stop:929 length:183 start_codon:yes stop_codon:yes gene_type:complete
MKMTIDALMQDVQLLKDEIKDVKDINKVLITKLEKAYGDRVELRAENFNMKDQLKGVANA